MAELAINGGPKAAGDLTIPDWPQPTELSEEYVLDSLHSGKWCRLNDGAKWVEQFEDQFSSFHDAEHAIAVSNGTVALELALKMCGIEPGDEVLVPSYTFIATASAVGCLGGVPKFVDVDPETYNIDPDHVREKITDDTVGIIGVHFGGYPIDFDSLLPIVEEHDLFLIEDAAHAHGSEWRGEKIGTLGDVGTFSFQASKELAGGEGGMVVTDDATRARQGLLHHNIGRDPGVQGYDHLMLASNYRMPELQGALLTAQLEKYPEEFETRQRGADVLADCLADIDGVSLQPDDERVTARAYEQFSINYDPAGFDGLSRDRFVEALRAEGVPTGVGYGLPLPKQQAFNRGLIRQLVPSDVDVPLYQNQHFPGTETAIRHRVTFRHQLLLADQDELRQIGDAVRKIEANADQLRYDP